MDHPGSVLHCLGKYLDRTVLPDFQRSALAFCFVYMLVTVSTASFLTETTALLCVVWTFSVTVCLEGTVQICPD